MFLVAIKRSVIFALQSFWRNIWLSLATIFIISLTFLSINFLVIINAISDSAIVAVKDRVDVSVYFKRDVKEDKINEVKNHLETLPQVKEIIYHSPEDNLKEFKAKHENDPVIKETLDELAGNPLGATLIIKAKDLESYPEVLKAIDNPAYSELVEEKNYNDHQLVINRINTIANNIRRGGLVISIIFVIIAALIVFNTVRIAIFTHRNEVGIMKLVGASNWFVRSPFILENIFSGILACLLAIIVTYSFLALLQPHLASFFEGVDFDVTKYFNEHFLIIFGLQLVGITILNIISSSLALGRYLRS
ncbi:MAG: permease-like cell division protein FtsX [Patescibacteria group bacterium]